MLNYQLDIVEEEFVTSIGDSDEFYMNLLFDHSIYRPMCTHMGYIAMSNSKKGGRDGSTVTLASSFKI